jgi:hypothetical protein
MTLYPGTPAATVPPCCWRATGGSPESVGTSLTWAGSRRAVRLNISLPENLLQRIDLVAEREMTDA